MVQIYIHGFSILKFYDADPLNIGGHRGAWRIHNTAYQRCADYLHDYIETQIRAKMQQEKVEADSRGSYTRIRKS